MAEKGSAQQAPQPSVVPLKGPVRESQVPPKGQAIDLLLRLEAEARRAATVSELKFLIANETLALTKAKQIFVLQRRASGQRVEAVSSVGTVEKNAPRIRWVEAIMRALAKDVGLASVRQFTLPAYCPAGDEEHKTYPYRFLAWFPMTLRDGDVFAGMLLARETPWADADIVIAARLAETYGHAWVALGGARRLRRRFPLKPLVAAGLIATIIAGFYPVPLTVLAPVEVTSVETRIVAAPIDGVVETVEVDPNATVAAGQLLIRMSDTALRNELDVAEQNVNVALARLKQISQGAIDDPAMRKDLAVARTELSLAVAKREYAQELLDRSRVTAPAAGVAIYTDKRDWIGRPVATGERLMELADPGSLELRIDVPVADAIAVRQDAGVRAFLDSDPLRPVEAKVRSASFEARMLEGNELAYRIYASPLRDRTGMRLGIRGTAQISGDEVPLAYYLFRRPISALRQRFGL